MAGIPSTLAKFLVVLSMAGLIWGARVAHAGPVQSSEVAPSSTALTFVAQRTSGGEPAAVSVPRLVQFTGTLKDAAGRPVSGAASVTFAVYAEQDGGTALWSETQNVIADESGRFNALLGGATANGLPAELFGISAGTGIGTGVGAGSGAAQSRWLGITIARQAEMPRVLLASVPYALKAGDADTLGGLPASEYVTAKSLAQNNARLAAPFSGNSASTTIIAAPQNSAAAPATLPISNATPTGSGTTNYVPLWTSGTALGNSLLYQTGGKIGVGTTTPTETLDVNGNSIFRGSFQLPPGHDATTSAGYESHSFQFQASSYNSGTKASTTQSFGFRAEPLDNNTANPSAALDLFFIPNGGSEFVNTGVSWSSTGIMTFAPGQTFSGTSETLTGSLNLPTSTSSTTGTINIGGQTFISDFGGNTNTFVGAGNGTKVVNGVASSDTAVGGGALASLTTGMNNTATGASALEADSSGGYNTAVGEQALEFTSTADNNVAVGAFAGSANETGSSNIFIGANAQPASAGLTNAVVIGANAYVGTSNSIVLGGIPPYESKVGIGSSSPGHTLEVIDGGTGGAGVWVLSTVSGDNAIEGVQSATGGESNGGYFYTDSNAGTGVVGVNAAGGKAGYFAGDVQVTGNLSKGGGSFKIDDPIAPAEKYLSHSFVESPDMMNIYNGIATLDARGQAVVQMPEWFDALNRDFRYQLTALGAPGPRLYIAEKVHDNQFKIAGGKKGQEISWQVTGIRHDAWANAHRIPTEEEKPANEQGHYIHPELFGAPPEQGISAMHGAAVPSSLPSTAPALDPDTHRPAAAHAAALRSQSPSAKAVGGGN
ncbi:MAG TPA: hypothetical protein VGD60_15795 [Candidatus Acidoferrales bacterium]